MRGIVSDSSGDIRRSCALALVLIGVVPALARAQVIELGDATCATCRITLEPVVVLGDADNAVAEFRSRVFHDASIPMIGVRGVGRCRGPRSSSPKARMNQVGADRHASDRGRVDAHFPLCFTDGTRTTIREARMLRNFIVASVCAVLLAGPLIVGGTPSANAS